MTAHPTDESQNNRQDRQGDRQTGILVKPFAVEKKVTGKDEQAAEADDGKGPGNGEQIPPEHIALLASSYPRLTVVEWMVAHASSLAVAWAQGAEIDCPRSRRFDKQLISA
jgi:hypothetical protein